VVTACLLSLGCVGAGSHSNASAPAPARAASLETLLVLPLNIATAMPQNLEVLRWAVEEEIASYLLQRGHQPRSIARNLARSQWLQGVQQAPEGETDELGAFDLAAGALARSLRERGEFDAMVVPSLVARDAPIQDRYASWDGAKQRLQLETRGLDSRRLRETPLEGVAPAASLHIAVFDAQGQKLHEALGGLEVLVRVRLTADNLRGEPAFQLLQRTDLLESPEAVREGIAIAFEPLIEGPD
jgi:hypothetical protein